MKPTTRRQKELAEQLTALIPLAPYIDAERIRTIAGGRKFRELPPSIAIWLATTTHVRHEHTDYDALLDEGYDRSSARHFVVDDINRVLTSWRSTRFVDDRDDDQDDTA